VRSNADSRGKTNAQNYYPARRRIFAISPKKETGQYVERPKNAEPDAHESTGSFRCGWLYRYIPDVWQWETNIRQRQYKSFAEVKIYMKTHRMSLLLAAIVLGMSGCNEDKTNMNKEQIIRASPTNARWYSQQQVSRGNVLYQENCASCHNADASGSTNWRKPDITGSYPPPPLNGTAHAWHHPLSALRLTIKIGGVPLGGTMPAFANKLDPQEIDAILAWVQSHWSDEIYNVWHERNTKTVSP